MWQRHNMGNTIHRDIRLTPDILNIQQMNHDRMMEKVSSVNSKIQKMYEVHETKKNEMNRKYDLMLMNMEVQQKDEEGQVLTKLTNDEISSKYFSDQITNIRAKYNELEKTLIKEKFQILEIMEKSHKQELNLLVDNYDGDREIDVKWNSGIEKYHAVLSVYVS